MRTTFFALAAAAVAAAASIAACSSSTPNPYPDVAAFCQALAKEECQVAPTCAIDPAACVQTRMATCNANAAAATASGSRAYDSNAAGACIDKTHQLFAQDKIVLADLQAKESVCQRVFAGNADKNKPCTTDYDCASGRICAIVAPGSAQKVCADPIAKNAGDFCADPGSQCAAGSYCAQTMGGAAQCQPRAQLGQPCGAVPCAETLRCSNGACVDRAPPGGMCTSNDDCSSTAGYCDPYANQICTVGLTFATGALDCKAFAPATQPPPQDAGFTPSPDAGTPADAATAQDAAGE